MKNEEIRKAVNTKLPESVIHRWHQFAIDNKLNKERALAEIIRKGTKKNRVQ